MKPRNKRKNLKPFTSVEDQSKERLELNRAQMSPRQFRDALTRADGAIPGIKTENTNWGRWSP